MYRRYVSIVRPRSYEPRALPLRHAGKKRSWVLEYRRYVSIVRPRSYEPRALPLRHADFPSLSQTHLSYSHSFLFATLLLLSSCYVFISCARHALPCCYCRCFSIHSHAPMLPCSHSHSNHSQQPLPGADTPRIAIGSGSKKKTEKQQENLGEREVMLGHSQRRGM